MSEPSKLKTLEWRFFVWMSEPSKLKGRAWRFFFWITPRWLSKKFQMYMLRCYVEHYPAEVDCALREAFTQAFGAPRSEEELAAWSKDALDLLLHPQASRAALHGYGIRFPR